MSVLGNAPKIVTFETEEDRAQWLRCFGLIQEMKKLGLDFGQISIFSFEKFQKDHLGLNSNEESKQNNEINDNEELKVD